MSFFDSEIEKIPDKNLREFIRKEGFYEKIESKNGVVYEFIRDCSFEWCVFINGHKVFDPFEHGFENPFSILPNYATLKKVKQIINKGLKDGSIKIAKRS